MIKDLLPYLKGLKQGASTPKEATSLEKLTELFEKMQVKYGSRWISVPALNRHLKIMVENPKETAKELYGTVFALMKLSDRKIILNLNFTMWTTKYSGTSQLRPPMGLAEIVVRSRWSLF